MDQEIVIGGRLRSNDAGNSLLEDYDSMPAVRIPSGAMYTIKYQDEYGKNKTLKLPFLATPSDYNLRDLDKDYVSPHDRALTQVVSKSYEVVFE